MEFAAKSIHQELSISGSAVVRDYVQECEIVSKLRHRNIVQFVGLAHLPRVSKLPLLVTELMDYNLHDYLIDERHANIPLSLKQSILEDIALGLNYLHDHNNIIHGDLTATNVLLNSALVAKIADFGNSRFLPEIYDSKKLSGKPGTALYMPPEACTDNCTVKLDIFSFGHLALFTLIQVSAVQ